MVSEGTYLRPIGIIIALVIIIALATGSIVIAGRGVKKVEKGGEKLSEGQEYVATVESHPLYVMCKKFFDNGFAREFYTKNAGKFNAITESCCENFCSEYEKCAINCGVLLTAIETHIVGKSLLNTEALITLSPYFQQFWSGSSKGYICPPGSCSPGGSNSYNSLQDLCVTKNSECHASDTAKELCQEAANLYWDTNQGSTIKDTCESTIEDICLSITSSGECDFDQLEFSQQESSVPAARIRAWYIEYILLGGNLLGLSYEKQNLALENLAKWLLYVYEN